MGRRGECINGTESVEAGLERFFLKECESREAVEIANQHITYTLDTALVKQDQKLLLSLISYIEAGEGVIAYKYTGELRRILRILHIVDLEQKYHKSSFEAGCTSKEMLLEKYMLSLFALRRLLFQLSEISMTEAADFIRRSRLSVFAVYTIIQDDLIIPNRSLYELLMEICADFWDESDINLFHLLINENGVVT